ncbi:hypothetical protein A2U01_0119327, partial [Trifolium medium]|nr:hypothetical protein [Trifolium medium]
GRWFRSVRRKWGAGDAASNPGRFGENPNICERISACPARDEERGRCVGFAGEA